VYRVWTMSKKQAIGKSGSSCLGGPGPRSRPLTLPDDPSAADMVDLTFYLAFQVAILASLPCYMTVYHDYMGGEGIWYASSLLSHCKRSARIAHPLPLSTNLRSFESNHVGSELDSGVERWSVPISCTSPTHISPRLILSHFPSCRETDQIPRKTRIYGPLRSG
jgi:hypothetical protein